MPNTVNQTVFLDGSKLATVHLYIESDGVSGEMANQLVIDMKNDIQPIGSPTQATIQQIWWGQSYYDARLSFQDTVPVPFWVLPVGSDSHVDFRSIGGLKVPVDLDGNANILLTTVGFAPAGSWGSYIIQLKKS
jgi:hypothetical protein